MQNFYKKLTAAAALCQASLSIKMTSDIATTPYPGDNCCDLYDWTQLKHSTTKVCHEG